MRYAICTVLLFLCVGAQADDLDQFVQQEMKRQNIPGVVIGVLNAGKADRIGCYGIANVELQAKCKPESVFKLASVSKQFIATGIMLLQQEGKLRTDDPVSKYFPLAPLAWSGIRIHHLLSHTSGLSREIPGWTMLAPYTDAEIESMAMKAALEFSTGEKYQYCNTGYFLLGLIINKVSGMQWSKYLHTKVFGPLGMSATRVTSLEDIIPNRVSGYELENGDLKNLGVLLSVRTSGSYVSNVLDMLKWERALQGGAPLTLASQDLMTQPTLLKSGTFSDYGFGWSVGKHRNRKLVRHSGSLLGFRTEYARYPDDKVAIIVLCNLASAEPHLIAEGIAERVVSVKSQ